MDSRHRSEIGDSNPCGCCCRWRSPAPRLDYWLNPSAFISFVLSPGEEWLVDMREICDAVMMSSPDRRDGSCCKATHFTTLNNRSRDCAAGARTLPGPVRTLPEQPHNAVPILSTDPQST
ncbi:unnamed protein product [Heligmosomoides polygyrus]|uniref:THAP-type domain-containing protein n=1 Tax=Heligmosomoides polygyrus TaxID=6339 RepID=A0A183G4T7_HELPZ|nr:unnamed protein product [Heligmosomoides polygyrus]